ncbi:MAG: T9SS type A sorting domain-containing protein [Candidatus Cloacimonetes bacterium]|nr:T9SS type A sorting domain-containing protein [Candidatus Cloacimonadota bacterium]
MRRLIFIGLVLCFALMQADWSENPEFNNQISSLAGDQTIPKIAQNPDGSCYIGWWSNATGNYNMRLQYIDADGNIVWDENGILVSDNTQMSWLTDWDMTIDHDGNAIMAFNDIREGEEQLDIFGYKITPEGEFAWGADGINLSNGGFNAAPKVTVTANNNCIFAWADDTSVIARSISPAGSQNWEIPITISEPETCSWPQLMAADNDGNPDNFLMKYFVDSGPYWAPDRFVYIQKYNFNGNPVWDSPAVVTNASGISAWNQIFSWAPDGSGGAVIAWHDDRNSENISRAYVQHIFSDGTALFEDGIQVGDHGANNQYYPQTIYQPLDENIYVYWEETDANQNNSGIFGQKINSDGELLYNSSGVNISPIQPNGGTIIALRPFGDDVVVSYSTYPWGNFNNERILAQRVDPEGENVWDEVLIVSDMQTTKMHTDTADIIYQDNGFVPDDGFIIAWGSGTNGIYAQRYNEDGSIGTQGPVLPAPVNLTAEAELYTIFLHWEMPDDRFLTGFELYRNNELLAEINDAGTREFGDYVWEYITYEYYLKAVYEEGISGPSNSVVVEIIEFPFPPYNLTVNPVDALMEWELPASPGRDLTGFNVYLDDLQIPLDYTTELFYQLNNLIAGNSYTAAVSAVYTNAESELISSDFTYEPVSTNQDAISDIYTRAANYPNPFNPETTIAFNLPQSAQVQLNIYNVKGQFIETLVNAQLAAGNHQMTWNATSQPSGIYYFSLKTEGRIINHRMVLLK